MKRLIFITALLVVSFTSDAQVVIRSNKDDNVKTVSSTVVKKEVIYKEKKIKEKKIKEKKVFIRYDAKRGFQQFVEASPKLDFFDFDKGHTGINYIGGWRFNNWLFVGAGTGIEFAHNVAHGARQYVGESALVFKEDNPYILYEKLRAYDMELEDYGLINLISVPLYAHLRTYFMRTAWAPYSSVSIGGRLAPKDSDVYFDFSLGVDYRANEKLHAYFSVGFWLSRFRNEDNRRGNDWFANHYNVTYDYYGSKETCDNLSCPYRNEKEYDGDYVSHYHYFLSDMFYRKFVYGGLSFRLGVSF